MRLSLVLLCSGRGAEAEPVVRTLSAFVAASVRGLICDAVLAGPPNAELGLIADHAGCAMIENETENEALRLALSSTRGSDVLILRSGHLPDIGLIEAIEDLLQSGRTQERGWILRVAPEGLSQRLVPVLAPAVGLLVGRRLCMPVSDPSFRHLIKATRARSASRLRLRRIA
ncbi:MAG TPA: transposase [Methylovirgula sp.]|nr:transposase [Methylovirgula sp.]